MHGLVALMEIQASRTRARVGADGRAGAAPRAGPRALGSAADRPRAGGARARRSARRRARPLRAAGRHRRLPRSRAHGRGHRLGAHRGALRRAGPARALARRGAQSRGGVSHGVRSGRRALELVDALLGEPSLEGYHLLPSVRGDLLAKLGRFDEARAEFERAASAQRTRASGPRCSSERRRVRPRVDDAGPVSSRRLNFARPCSASLRS